MGDYPPVIKVGEPIPLPPPAPTPLPKLVRHIDKSDSGIAMKWRGVDDTRVLTRSVQYSQTSFVVVEHMLRRLSGTTSSSHCQQQSSHDEVMTLYRCLQHAVSDRYVNVRRH